MNTNAQRFTASTGSHWFITVDDVATVQQYLAFLGFLLPEERVIHASRAGEGNMNLTVRIRTTRRQFILKQSRPWVAKYPDLPAPAERILVERDYLKATAEEPLLAAHSPEVLRADSENFVLLLEDLKGAKDLSSLYDADHTIKDRELKNMLQYLSVLHRMNVPEFPENRSLRELNHAHIFDLPFRADNGFPLDAIYPGLAVVAKPFQNDPALRNAAAALGQHYLGEGKCLIHGDFYPGSLMTDEGHLYVIDGEFAHHGLPEFDLGVLTAHLHMAGTPPEQIEESLTYYDKPPGFDTNLANQFCQVEIIRRIIGIAQLPLSLSLEERQKLLSNARAALR